jgi:hypothetical protein
MYLTALVTQPRNGHGHTVNIYHVIIMQPVYWRFGRIYRKHSFLYCCVLDRVYRAIAWQLVDQIRYVYIYIYIVTYQLHLIICSITELPEGMQHRKDLLWECILWELDYASLHYGLRITTTKLKML